jgi:RNA 3'-terminal phosphate cyclase-like protein
MGGVIRHEIPRECSRRGASWWLIPLALLSPFAKDKLNVVLHGEGCITSSTPAGDVSVDSVRTAILPLFKSFGIECPVKGRAPAARCSLSLATKCGYPRRYTS